jgi:ABC-2 type transport system permease protein
MRTGSISRRSSRPAASQIALAPGYLQKSWKENGRSYFQYKMDQKMMPFFAYLSADWQVKKGDWHGIPIEIYHDRKHGYNVDRMITATQKSLDYYTTQFTPYQHKQVRILEFPNYASFAQSFANTIPFSESIGFIADLRDKEDIDYVFYVTAHEMAHQWWGHQIAAANVQGSTMLIESLAQYSALMVMEKEYGPHQMRRFLRYELDRYLSSRGSEAIEELPLYRVENQQYIHYRKGSLIFYRLRDEIGEAALNRALKRFLQDKGFQEAPFTTSAELLDYIRAEAPADKQALITDMFEKIVFYDNRVLRPREEARRRPVGCDDEAAPGQDGSRRQGQGNRARLRRAGGDRRVRARQGRQGSGRAGAAAGEARAHGRQPGGDRDGEGAALRSGRRPVQQDDRPRVARQPQGGQQSTERSGQHQ